MRSAKDTASAAIHRHERQLESLIDRLPNGLQAKTRWLRRPSSRWARIPAGVLLIGGSVLSILPFLGLWMLPLGVILRAEDIPPLRRARAPPGSARTAPAPLVHHQRDNRGQANYAAIALRRHASSRAR
jgi:hypothetical protein